MDDNNTPVKSNNGLFAILGLVILIALVVGGYFYFQNQESDSAGNTNGNNIGSNEAQIPSSLETEGNGPVARVNGEEIEQSEYNKAVQQLISNYAAQGTTITDEEAPQVKEQVITTLVNRQLVLQAATEAGITVDDAAVETEYQNTLTNLGGEDSLKSALENAGITNEELRDDLREGLMMNAYLDSQLDLNNISVTDEEVEAYYNSAAESAGETEVPPLADVRELIENQLVSQTQQELINAEIERLRSAAEIEVLI